MDIQTLQRTVHDFAAVRHWPRFHTPKNLAMALMVEAAELLEIFQWLTPDESSAAASDAAQKQHIGEEIADVQIYLLQMAEHTQVDLSAAVLDKLQRNARKYPVPAGARDVSLSNHPVGAAAPVPPVPSAPPVLAGDAKAVTHVLLDFENVQPTDAELRALVPQANKLWVFHGPHQRKMTERFASFGHDLTVVPISKSGKNALDFHLSFYMGYIAARNPAARFVVVANDKGYEPMLEHARQLHFDVLAVGMPRVRKAAAKTAAAPRKTARAPAVAAKTPARKTRVKAEPAPLPSVAEAPGTAAAPTKAVPRKSRTTPAAAKRAPVTQAVSRSAEAAASAREAAPALRSGQKPPSGAAPSTSAKTGRKPARTTTAEPTPTTTARAVTPPAEPRRGRARKAATEQVADVQPKPPSQPPSQLRNRSSAPRAKAAPAPSAAPAAAAAPARPPSPPDAAQMTKVEQGLRKLGAKRPVRLARLRGVLKSLLGGEDRTEVIDTALQRLLAAGQVRVDADGAVRYPAAAADT
jgi:NTP pyrophosphatase (non-canonical NTP hydrolase)